MAEKKNELFEKAWDKYSNPFYRKVMQERLPYVAKLFSSGNRAQAEQEFNAALFSATYGTNPFKNELAWAASGRLPLKSVDINAVDKDGKLNADTSDKNMSMDKAAKEFFVANPQYANDAENYYSKVKSFKKQGYTDDESKMYSMPVDTFKGLSKAIDAKAQYKYAGKDNKVHSVIEDFHDRRTTPKEDEIATGDLIEKQDADKMMLAKMFGGNTSEVVGDNANLNNLEDYAKDLGFVDSDALIEYLSKSYDRKKRLKDQEDDGLATWAAKTLFLDNVSKKWDEGIPASTGDVLHDAALVGLEVAPQGKAVGLIGRGAKTVLPKTKALSFLEKTVTNPTTGYLARKAALPTEAAFIDASFNGRDEGVNLGDIGQQTLANMMFDATANGAIRKLDRYLRGVPSIGTGSFLLSNKSIAKDLEKRAYEMALENEAAQAAHNLMLRVNPDFRAKPSIMYGKLSGNQNFSKKFNLGGESFDRVFNDAWNSAKHAGAGVVPTGKPSLKTALKSLDSYKKTDDFKKAIEAAAWEKAGYKGGNLLNSFRDNPYLFNVGLENADAAKQATLMRLYNDYARKKKGFDKAKGFAKYEAGPFLRNYLENLFSVKRVYGQGLNYMKNGAGFKKDDEK